MPNPTFASKRTENIFALTLLINLFVEKKGVARIASLFLICTLLAQGFLVYPLRTTNAGGNVSATSLVSNPPEPFTFHSSPSDIGKSSIFASALTRLTEVLSDPKSPEDKSPANLRHSPKRAVSEKSALLNTEPIESNPDHNVLAAAYTTNKAASGIIFDYDEDGKADVGRWNASTHEFKIKNSTNNSYSTTTGLGTSTSKPVAGDLNGDGKTDAVVYNPGNSSTSGTWSYMVSPISTTATATPTPISIGVSGNSTSDIPVAGYFDSDAITDVGVFRPSTGYWYIKESNSSTTTSVQYGQSNDIPVMGDYDGDGKTDKAVFRPCETGTCDWYILRTTTGTGISFPWGQKGDIPVQGDYDGDGTSDLAVYRPTEGIWYIAKITTTGIVQIASVGWGNYGDQPVPADYDNDDITDYAVWRPTTGVWYIIGSVPIPDCEGCPQYLYRTLGSAGDKALPSVYTNQVGATISGNVLARDRVAPRNATGATNLYSQNFFWGTSLVNLPGRAGLDAGLSLSYNSLVWLQSDVGGSETVMSFDPDKSNVSPGFRFGFPVIEPIHYDSNKKVWNYMMVTPSGARKEFRQVAASSIYESGDSDYTQLVTTGASNPNDPVENITIKVTSTDGTQMSYSWIAGAFRCNKILDRNGNYISISNDEQGLLRTVTDTLGRVITVNYDIDLYPTSITQSWKNSNGAGSSTTHTWATFTYTTKEVQTNFDANTGAAVPDGTDIKVLEKVIYADTSYTKFLYNSYIQVTQIENYADDDHRLNYVRTNLDAFSGTSPTPSDCPRFTHTYNWAENFNMSSGSPPAPQETDTENTAPSASSFEGPEGEESTMVVNVKMDGLTYDHYSRLHFAVATEDEPWKTGLPVATEDCTDTGSTCSTRQRWTWTNWEQDQVGSTPFDYPVNPRVIETHVGDGENTRRTIVSYLPASSTACTGSGIGGTMEPEEGTNVACFGLATDTAIYGSGSTPLKRSVTEYNLSSNYTSKRIIGLPSETRLYDENDDLMSKVTFTFDDYTSPNPALTDLSNPTRQCRTTSTDCPSAYNTSFQYRGNLTSTTRWNVDYPTNSSYAATSRVAYNIAGLPVSQTDPLNRTTSISYTDVWNDSVSRTTYAYPTTVTDPANNSSTIKYRFDIGTNVWAQSPIPYGGSTTNTVGKTTSREYSTTTGRIVKEKIDNTGAYTKYDYGTDGISLSTKSTIIHEGSGSPGTGDEVETVTLFDGAGRALAVRSPHTYSGSSVSTWSATLTQYDMLGRVSASSVPTEVSVSGNTWTPAGDDYTRGFVYNRSYYDWKDRVVRTRPSDSDGTNEDKDTLISYNGCGCAGGQVTTIEGPVVPRDDTTGTARRKQKVTEDILGRQAMMEVFEWNGSTVHSTTTNTYNGRDQITSIKEYAGTTSGTMQETTMSYDGHGRLYQKHLPQWYGTNAVTDKKYSTTTYNADDTVATVTDPRGAVTTYTYENVSGTPKRPLVTNIAYSAPSPIATPSAVTFAYDATGNRTSMSDGTGTLTYTYDELSRLKTETKDFTDEMPDAPSGGVYTLSYNYHLTGGIKSITDPFGYVVNYSVDKTGRMTDIGNASNVSKYAHDIEYRAFGAVKKTKLSATQSIDITFDYDNALRLDEYEATSAANQNDIHHSSYSYNNDSKLGSVTNIADSNFSKTSQYDFAGRLKLNDVGTGTAVHPFKQTLNYDAFDNPTRRKNWNYSFDPIQFDATYENNRKTGDSSGDSTYDAAGNVVENDDPGVDRIEWKFDAAGRSWRWEEHGPFGPTTTKGEVTKFDGDGRGAKRIEFSRSLVGGVWMDFSTNWYYIYSSVTGQKITDVVVDGGYGGTNVYMGSTIIAEQKSNGHAFKVNDPITGSVWETNSGGVAVNHEETRTEKAALNTSVPLTEPTASLPPDYLKGANPFNAEVYAEMDGTPMLLSDALQKLDTMGVMTLGGTIWQTTTTWGHLRWDNESETANNRINAGESYYMEKGGIVFPNDPLIVNTSITTTSVSLPVFFGSTPFVIRNADRFFDQIVKNTLNPYQNKKGTSHCALLPLGWENDQDAWYQEGQGRRRMTPNWSQGARVTDGMNLARGTVLASGWVNGRYTNKEAGEGNHVVVFDRFGTDERGRRGMYVAEQLGGNRRPEINFKAFGEGNYAWDASQFNVVEFQSIDEPLKIDNNDRRTLGQATESCADTGGS